MIKPDVKIKRNIKHDVKVRMEKYAKEAAKQPSIFVGFPGKKGGEGIKYPATGTPVASVAFWQEFGAERANIPPRPFLRPTMREKKKDYQTALRNLAKVSLTSGKDMSAGLKKLGHAAVADIKAAIVKLQDPPNAPSTIRKKKRSNPLIDTNLMTSSVTFELREKAKKGEK